MEMIDMEEADAFAMRLLDELDAKSDDVQTKGESTVKTTELDVAQKDKPEIIISGENVTHCMVANELGKLFHDKQILYSKGGVISEVGTDLKENPVIERVKPEKVVTVFERVAQLKKETVQGRAGVTTKSARCTMQDAKIIMAADEFVRHLPKIKNVINCPVLVKNKDGSIKEVSGYDREHQLLASPSYIEDVPLGDAVKLIKEAVHDYRFAAGGDRSRAISGFITPAFIMGGLLDARAPVDLGEADKSQSGKGYRAKCVAAVYKNVPSTLTEKSGGVGSLRETLDSVLYKGATFISLDNIKGKVDIPALESLLTEDSYTARPPYMGSVEIDPARVYIMMTSNKANLTEDLANRSCCVRIVKQQDGYQYKAFNDGDVLDHIRANQPLYLGAVFSVIKEWHKQGCQRTSESRHSFRKWAQTMDWIVQNIFNEVPLLDGHKAAQLRMANPDINWLRDVAYAVKNQARTYQDLATHQLCDIMKLEGVEIPDSDDEPTILRELGKILARCFSGGDEIDLGDMKAKRIEVVSQSENGKSGTGTRKRYSFEIT